MALTNLLGEIGELCPDQLGLLAAALSSDHSSAKSDTCECIELRLAMALAVRQEEDSHVFYQHDEHTRARYELIRRASASDSAAGLAAAIAALRALDKPAKENGAGATAQTA